MSIIIKTKKLGINREILVEGDGFEPSKTKSTDLQSVAFGRSATLPNLRYSTIGRITSGASEGNRTPNLLITSQLLYR